MFTRAERDEIGALVLEALEADTRIELVSPFGSVATGVADRHSDVDLSAVVREDVDTSAVAADWIERLPELVPVLHRFHERFGPIQACGFLLENHLEIDIGFAHAAEAEAFTHHEPPDHERLSREWLDFAWHDVTHAAIALDRRRPIRALFYVERMRDRAVRLACLRLGLDDRHHKAADELPGETRAALAPAVAGSLEIDELWRALRAATRAFYSETRHVDPELSDRLERSLETYLDELESGAAGS